MSANTLGLARHFGDPAVYEAEFDRPSFSGERRYYLICGAPRVGSWLLCDLLESSGVMGVPAEYFNTHSGFHRMTERFGLIGDGKVNLNAYIQALKESRTGANGVLGIKIQYWMMDPLLKDKVISRHFPGIRFIYLDRYDIINQGVSYAIARRTQQWTKPSSERALDFDSMKAAPDTGASITVEQAIKLILRERASWHHFFALNQIKPLRLNYEDLIDDTDSTCKSICAHVGIETDWDFSLQKARIRKQDSPEKEEWVRRLREKGGY